MKRTRTSTGCDRLDSLGVREGDSGLSANRLSVDDNTIVSTCLECEREDCTAYDQRKTKAMTASIERVKSSEVYVVCSYCHDGVTLTARSDNFYLDSRHIVVGEKVYHVCGTCTVFREA